MPAGSVETTPDPPSVPQANAQIAFVETHGMDGHQLVQWFTASR